MDKPNFEDKTTIALDVLLTIAKLTALGVQGVSRLAPTPTSFDRFINKGMDEGIKIVVENNTVYVDLFVIIKHGFNVRDVSHIIQTQVSRAISEMVGMDVGKINIHVEDVDFVNEPTA